MESVGAGRSSQSASAAPTICRSILASCQAPRRHVEEAFEADPLGRPVEAAHDDRAPGHRGHRLYGWLRRVARRSRGKKDQRAGRPLPAANVPAILRRVGGEEGRLLRMSRPSSPPDLEGIEFFHDPPRTAAQHRQCGAPPSSRGCARCGRGVAAANCGAGSAAPRRAPNRCRCCQRQRRPSSASARARSYRCVCLPARRRASATRQGPTAPGARTGGDCLSKGVARVSPGRVTRCLAAFRSCKPDHMERGARLYRTPSMSPFE